MRFTSRRVRTVGAAAVLATASLLLAGCTDAAPPAPADIADPLPDEVIERLQSSTERAIGAAGAPGAIVGVWAPWAGEWIAGVGETAPGSGTAPSPDMQFRAGPVTRSMTCDVLYALDGGAVNLDDSVSDLVPSVPPLEDVTLVDLCDGVAGLKSSEAGNWNSILSNPDRVWDPREYAARGLGEGLGERGVWSNSDTSFFLLGLALENATRTPMPELYEEYVADPQGLGDTYLPGDASAAPGSNPFPGFYSSSKVRENGCEEPPRDMTELSSSIGYAGSGIVSSVGDLGDYVADLASSAGSSDALEQRWAQAVPLEADGPQWMRAAGGDRLLGSMIGQEGKIFGYITAAYSDIDTGLTVVVTINNSAAGGDLAGALARELAAIALETPGDDRPEASLPWTAAQAHDEVGDAAVCPID